MKKRKSLEQFTWDVMHWNESRIKKFYYTNGAKTCAYKTTSPAVARMADRTARHKTNPNPNSNGLQSGKKQALVLKQTHYEAKRGILSHFLSAIFARCVTFAVVRICVGNRRNFAYFSLWHPKYGRQGMQKGLHGSEDRYIPADQISLWSINCGRL